jgi:peptidoglycan/xylan/chitin deacetylase (PgdA/CDA1 family)
VSDGPHAPDPHRGREIAITFDDLPAICVTGGDLATHHGITRRLLDALIAHGIESVGFVNEVNLMADGRVDEARAGLLRQWLDAGQELGNHTYGHLDMHRTQADRFEDDVVRGEPVTRELLRERGMALRWFRHPYLHTGTDLASKRRFETFLAGRGYRVAPATIFTEDYLFAAAYDRATRRGDRRTARRVAEAYVPYVESHVAYYEALSRRLLGYEVRQTLVLHANSINADCFDALALMLERRSYRFVTLERALEDPAYAAPDPYASAHGISWLQRWAINQGRPAGFLDGEPATPWFVRLQAESGRGARLMRWWNHWSRARHRAMGAA